MKASCLALLAAIAVLLSCPAYAGEDASQDQRAGQWLQFRGDRALTGRSLLKGNISSPEIKWKYFIGAREALMSVSVGGQGGSVKLPDSDLRAANIGSALSEWSVGYPTFDVDENGVLISQLSDSSGASGRILAHVKIGKWVREWPGLQKVQTDNGFLSHDKADPTYCRLYRRENGDWKEVWRSLSVSLLYTVEPIVGDFDNDGKLEVAFLPWNDV